MKCYFVFSFVLLVGCTNSSNENKTRSDEEILNEMTTGIEEYRASFATKDSIMWLIHETILTLDSIALAKHDEDISLDLDFQSYIPFVEFGVNPNKNAFIVNYKFLQDSLQGPSIDDKYYANWDDDEIALMRERMTNGYSFEEDYIEMEDQDYKSKTVKQYINEMKIFTQAEYLVVICEKTFTKPKALLFGDSFISGYWTGTGVIFDFNTAAVLCSFEIEAENSDELKISYNETIDNETLEIDLQHNIHDEVVKILEVKYGANVGDVQFND